jgi:Polysaccharide pyruvyl transferase.
VENNWGDALNPVLIEHMTGKKVFLSTSVFNLFNEDVYWAIGSILGNYSDKNQVVWGSGIISKDVEINCKPKKILAVRGPRTRDILFSKGLDCPEIYGDPAMLYPYYYKPNIKKKYQLGLIPHYVDHNNSLLDLFKHNSNIKIINILDDVNKTVDDICSCERVASSSLHGIIAADAYGIPSIWIEFSDNVIGNGFKFYDYFEAVGRDEECLRITENTTVEDIYSHYKEYNINIDLNKLVSVCPFLTKIQKEELKAKINKKNLPRI